MNDSTRPSIGKRSIIFFLLLTAIVIMLVLIWKRLPVPSPAPSVAPPVTNVTPPTTTPPTTQPTSTAVTPPVVTPPVTPPADLVCDSTNSICADRSVQNALLTNPMIITGTAIAFESQFSWKLVYKINGQELVYTQGTAMANAPDMGKPGPFEIRAFLPLLQTPPSAGTLVLYEASAKDGSPIHVLNIPVRLPTAVQTVTIYYSNQYAVRQGDCTQATPVKVQMLRSITPIEATLRRLLEETANSEIANEFIGTQIPDGTTLKSLVLAKDGTVTVTFNPGLDVGGGRCHMSAIRAQIDATLKQFPSVKKVVITVDGKTPETTLQP